MQTGKSAPRRADDAGDVMAVTPISGAGFGRTALATRLWGGGSGEFGPERLDWWTDGTGPSSLYGADLF